MKHQSSVARCVLCESVASTRAFPYETKWDQTHFEYFRCGGCEAVFVSPLPTDAQFEKMYANTDYHGVHYAHFEPARQAPAVRRLTHALASLGRAPRDLHLLDYGCGTGEFLKAAAEVGFQATGAEYSEGARAAAATRTALPVLRIDSVMQSTHSDDVTFDVIRFGDVLEHLPRPAETLRTLARRLNPGGLFAFEGPLQANPSLVYAAAQAAKQAKLTLGRDRPGSSPPTHLIQVSARTQRFFFENTLGWKVEWFKHWETGWPYVYESSALTLSSSQHLRAGIGLLARGVAKLPVLSKYLGNRFCALVRPQECA